MAGQLSTLPLSVEQPSSSAQGSQANDPPTEEQQPEPVSDIPTPPVAQVATQSSPQNSDTMGRPIAATVEPMSFWLDDYRWGGYCVFAEVPSTTKRRRQKSTLDFFSWIRKNKDRISLIAVSLALIAGAINERVTEYTRDKLAEIQRLVDRDEGQKQYYDILIKLTPERWMQGVIKTIQSHDTAIVYATEEQAQRAMPVVQEALGLEMPQIKLLSSSLNSASRQDYQLLVKHYEDITERISRGPKSQANYYRLIVGELTDYLGDAFKLINDLRAELAKEELTTLKQANTVSFWTLWALIISVLCAILSQVVKGKAEIEVKPV